MQSARFRITKSLVIKAVIYYVTLTGTERKRARANVLSFTFGWLHTDNDRIKI